MPVSAAQEDQKLLENMMDNVTTQQEKAIEESEREMQPGEIQEFTQQDILSLVPVVPEEMDSEDEEIRLKEHLQADLDAARNGLADGEDSETQRRLSKIRMSLKRMNGT